MAKKKAAEMLQTRDEAEEAGLLADIEEGQAGQDVEGFVESWDLMSFYADWLDDRRRPETDAVRWLCAERKRAYKATDTEWTWFVADKIAEGLGDPTSDLPAVLFDKLDGFTIEEASHKKWESFVAAIQAVLRAYPGFAAAAAEKKEDS